ncbi:hypothetical protein [Uliginosibacterium gangwonense]|uniref:hypothetical protein n=1 Tax=Uliginosibacterium gangwonense TaxID=392736 RepID=UPI0003704E0A|nr:hypothetical protein [Uliginosibacterium gangwonense]
MIDLEQRLTDLEQRYERSVANLADELRDLAVEQGNDELSIGRRSYYYFFISQGFYMAQLINSTHAEIARALETAGFDLPHADISSLRAPYLLAVGDTAIASLMNPTGTVVVIGNLTVEEDIDARRVDGIANIVVTGNLSVRHAYFDAFLIVGGVFTGSTIIADSTWDGGLFVGELRVDTLVLKDCDLSYLGDEKITVNRLADFENEDTAKETVPELFQPDPDEIDVYDFFCSLNR